MKKIIKKILTTVLCLSFLAGFSVCHASSDLNKYKEKYIESFKYERVDDCDEPIVHVKLKSGDKISIIYDSEINAFIILKCKIKKGNDTFELPHYLFYTPLVIEKYTKFSYSGDFKKSLEFRVPKSLENDFKNLPVRAFSNIKITYVTYYNDDNVGDCDSNDENDSDFIEDENGPQ